MYIFTGPAYTTSKDTSAFYVVFAQQIAFGSHEASPPKKNSIFDLMDSFQEQSTYIR